MASPVGVEPTASGLGIPRSILLSYGDVARRLAWFGAVFILLGGLNPAAACDPGGGFEGARGQAHPGAPAVELRLEDGRVVKLAGLIVPEPAAADARLTLDRLLAGRALSVRPLLAAPDRYGRTLARVLADGVWVEGTLAASGVALASLSPGETDCLEALLKAERHARERGRGVWSVPGFPLAAHDTRSLTERIGQYVVVEGAIISVGVRDYATFLNFGRRWTEDFAVIIPRSVGPRMEERHGALAALRGQVVRVRGLVEAGGAPRMRLTEPLALERRD